MAPDPSRFAALLCDYCLDVQPGQQVVVRSTTLAAPLMLALQEELLVREAWPLLRTEVPGADEGFWQHARDAHLEGFPDAELARRWCLTLWPTAAGAQQAGMGTTEFAAFVRRALFLDRGEATASWSELRHFQARLIERLTPARELRIEAEGTDLTLSVEGRTWVNSDGKRNMPSGEVFTGPHEASAEGHIRFTVRSSPAGVDVDGVELELRGGEVVAAR